VNKLPHDSQRYQSLIGGKTMVMAEMKFHALRNRLPFGWAKVEKSFSDPHFSQ
jgi:hypothetical protein